MQMQSVVFTMIVMEACHVVVCYRSQKTKKLHGKRCVAVRDIMIIIMDRINLT